MDKEQTIEKHLDLLSIEEKVAQLMVLGLTGTFVEPELIRFIEKYGLGGLRLSPHLARKFVRYLPDGSPGFKNVNRAPSLQEKIFDNSIPPMRITAKEYAEILNDLRKKAFERTKGLPLHMVADFESDGGDFTPPGMISAPAAMGFGDLGDTDLIKRILSAVGRQIKAVGIDWIHSPVADVNVNRNNPEIYTRSYSEDTDKATNCIRAALEGLKEAGVIACLKHFPGRGGSDKDAHFGLCSIDLSKEEMMQNHIKPYAILAKEKMITSIMPAHTVFPSLDDSGEVATVSPKIISGILREELGYDGVITTDSMTMGGLMAKYSVGEACVRAIEAGIDLLLLKDENVLRYELLESLVNAIKSGRISEKRIDQSLRRIWSLKWDYGLFENGGIVDASQTEATLQKDEFKKTGKEAAQKVIRVKRDDEKLLPLDPAKNILLIDKVIFSQISRNDSWNHPGMMWKFMLRHSPNISYVDYQTGNQEKAKAAAEKIIDQIDCIVVTAHFNRGEHVNEDKKFISELKKYGKPIVMVSSNPYEELLIPEDIGTVVVSYSLMRESLEAVSEFLFKGK
jgi:beta-N-acetylhexosaminidase